MVPYQEKELKVRPSRCKAIQTMSEFVACQKIPPTILYKGDGAPLLGVNEAWVGIRVGGASLNPAR